MKASAAPRTLMPSGSSNDVYPSPFFCSCRPFFHLSVSFPVFALVLSLLSSSTMARTKQSTPLRREPSSEYFTKGDPTGTASRSSRKLDRKAANGYGISNAINAHRYAGVPGSSALTARKDAGAVQFLIAVAGIYGSLLVFHLYLCRHWYS